MESAVSWQGVISVMKLRHPDADQAALVHLAKQFYLSRLEAGSCKVTKGKSDFSSTRTSCRNKLIIQGA